MTTIRTPAVMGEGLLTSGIGLLIGPVPAGQRWYVTRLDCYNRSASSDIDITLFLRTGASEREWKGARLDRGGGHCEAIDRAVELEAGDAIYGRASIANQVTFYAGGIKEVDTGDA